MAEDASTNQGSAKGKGMISNEILGTCPLCGAESRTILYRNICDNTFFAVSGHWSLWRCLGCGCVYLDPRPTRSTISVAYRNYYTHSGATKPRYEDLSPLRKIRRRLANGYAHWRYGADLGPRSSWGVMVALLAPHLRRIIDFDYRHLPGGGNGAGRSLLDVGCGNGNFLALVTECGWKASGVDPDAEAVAEGLRRGVDVQLGGLEVFAGETECFDVITMHHVIEHLHDPIGALSDCYRLLKPGGVLWLATPNLDSFAHAWFGRNWRGLEAPRHLILFNERTLRKAMEDVGFSRWRRLSVPSAHLPMVRSSFAMAQGRSPNDASLVLPLGYRFASILTTWLESVRPARREFLFVAAAKRAS